MKYHDCVPVRWQLRKDSALRAGLRSDCGTDESPAIGHEAPTRRVGDGVCETLGVVIERDENLALVGANILDCQAQLGRHSRKRQLADQDNCCEKPLDHRDAVDSLFRRFAVKVFVIGLRIIAGVVNHSVAVIRRRI